MGKVARPRIITKEGLDTAGLPEHVQVALEEIAASAREGVLALSVACGLAVIEEIMAADVTRICGPRGKHVPERTAYRHGDEPRLVPLGGALTAVEKPRMRSTDGKEVPLPSYEVFARRDLLDETALGRMLAGLSTRRYRAGADPVGDVPLRGVSRSTISRRFRRGTQAKLAELFHRDLGGLDLVALFIDGMAVGNHMIVVALGVDCLGIKHPLGLWEGTTENKTVCTALINNLIDRGLPDLIAACGS
ncbi:MAG: transposase [Anaerolineales bacterium]